MSEPQKTRPRVSVGKAKRINVKNFLKLISLLIVLLASACEAKHFRADEQFDNPNQLSADATNGADAGNNQGDASQPQGEDARPNADVAPQNEADASATQKTDAATTSKDASPKADAAADIMHHSDTTDAGSTDTATQDAGSTDAGSADTFIDTSKDSSTDSSTNIDAGTNGQTDAASAADTVNNGSTDASDAGSDAGSTGSDASSNGSISPINKDAGSTDTATQDAGSTDAGSIAQTDAGSTDSSADTASTDAGTSLPCIPTTEVCDGKDNDCDGQTDEGLETFLFFPDTDKDGFGDGSAVPLSACATPTGYVLADSAKLDCNDGAVSISPAVTEDCGNGVDDNCNGVTDEGCTVTIQIPELKTGYNLEIGYEVYTDASKVGTGEWHQSLPAEATDTVSFDFGHDKVDIANACGVRINITFTNVKTKEQSWLCMGNGKNADLPYKNSSFYDLFWNSKWFSEVDPEFMIWSAPNGQGCSLIFVHSQEGKCKF